METVRWHLNPPFYQTILFAFSVFTPHLLQPVSADQVEHYVNEWAAEIPGGWRVAIDVAEQHGFAVVRELLSLPDHYLLKRSDTPHRSQRSAIRHTQRLEQDERVMFVEQQRLLHRTKRDVLDPNARREEAPINIGMHDPAFSHQWYINQESLSSNRRDVIMKVTDLRVMDVWKRGITGKNIVVTILDDGIERDHPDLIDNYDPQASYDLNSLDDDPTPRYEPTNENKHGTRCAGVVSMKANNSYCGIGIAHDSKIGGIRILDGNVTDSLEAQAIAFRPQHIDIYSASWGPKDDGKSCDMPATLTRKAIDRGIKEGRQGKGSLYVWASGNGGVFGDNCNADGYVAAIETISVSSATQAGRFPFYAEKCSSVITTAYSSGSFMEQQIVSADLHHKCTDHHTGTSAAAPMVSGIIALLLEVNPNVTWRDVQHILVHTSRMQPLDLETGWYRNGVGYCVNLAFGFGLIDALAVVELGNPKTWKNVGEQRKCVVYPVYLSLFPRNFTSGQHVEVEFQTDGCAGTENEVNYLEHIQVVFDVNHQRRGNIYADLQSPMGTKTPLILERENDASTKGFKKWPLMSLHNWGERPQGKWMFRVADRSNNNFKGQFNNATLILYGTKLQPEHQKLAKTC